MSIRTQDAPDWVAGVVTSVEQLRDSYRRRARWHRRWFRSTGVVVILLSTSLPALTIPDYGAKKALISIVGVFIALLTGLRSFYQWDQLWSVLRQSDFELSFLLDKWQLDVGAIVVQSDPERLLKLHELTVALRDAAEDVRRSESTRYFGSLSFPHTTGA